MTTINACANGLSGTTGSGQYVGSTSPTLVTPNIGVATATSVNGTSIPSSSTLVVSTNTGLATAWAYVTNNGTATLVNSKNVTSVTRNSAGNVTVTFTTPMSDSNYIILITAAFTAEPIIASYSSKGTNSFVVQTNGGGGGDLDADFNISVFGT